MSEPNEVLNPVGQKWVRAAAKPIAVHRQAEMIGIALDRWRDIRKVLRAMGFETNGADGGGIQAADYLAGREVVVPSAQKRGSGPKLALMAALTAAGIGIGDTVFVKSRSRVVTVRLMRGEP